MRYCRHCKVNFSNDIPYCPLCDMKTDLLDDAFDEDYPYVKSRFSRGLLLRMITFFAIVFTAASLLINHLVPTGNPWAFITAAAIVYVWLSAIGILKSTPNPASIMMGQLFTVSGFVVLLDYLTGWHHWSVTYVIPALIIAEALALLLMILIRPQRFRAYTIYQLFIAILGVLSLFLWIFGVSDVEWPVVTAASVSIICFFAMLMFSHRKTSHELTKRFHV
ncbi:MAG: hypothetical protein E7632_03040 [Ruminococcaceae bacterium]|nr:hypothetical protein [Oscillospiraceae bacterium]